MALDYHDLTTHPEAISHVLLPELRPAMQRLLTGEAGDDLAAEAAMSPLMAAETDAAPHLLRLAASGRARALDLLLEAHRGRAEDIAAAARACAQRHDVGGVPWTDAFAALCALNDHSVAATLAGALDVFETRLSDIEAHLGALGEGEVDDFTPTFGDLHQPLEGLGRAIAELGPRREVWAPLRARLERLEARVGCSILAFPDATAGDDSALNAVDPALLEAFGARAEATLVALLGTRYAVEAFRALIRLGSRRDARQARARRALEELAGDELQRGLALEILRVDAASPTVDPASFRAALEALTGDDRARAIDIYAAYAELDRALVEEVSARLDRPEWIKVARVLPEEDRVRAQHRLKKVKRNAPPALRHAKRLLDYACPKPSATTIKDGLWSGQQEAYGAMVRLSPKAAVTAIEYAVAQRLYDKRHKVRWTRQALHSRRATVSGRKLLDALASHVDVRIAMLAREAIDELPIPTDEPFTTTFRRRQAAASIRLAS